MADYLIYTDGACSGNPGPGGYAYIIVKNGKEIISAYGHKAKTTNNCMELTAIVNGLKYIVNLHSWKKLDIDILSDSAYCVNSVNLGWIYFWQKNGWKTKAGKNVKNKELWERLVTMLEENKNKLNVKLIKVKGHDGDKYNELADKYATSAIHKQE